MPMEQLWKVKVQNRSTTPMQVDIVRKGGTGQPIVRIGVTAHIDGQEWSGYGCWKAPLGGSIVAFQREDIGFEPADGDVDVKFYWLTSSPPKN